MESDLPRQTIALLGTHVDVLGWETALQRIERWAQARESRYVCICNAHSIVESSDDPGFRVVIDQADMATPDGTPVAWMLRRLGAPTQERINGPDLMLKYCALAEVSGTGIYLYGGRPEVLEELRSRLRGMFPRLVISGMSSPPFRVLTEEERQHEVQAIADSGAGVVFVGLGCPKQERWMAAQRGQVPAVMIGVGAAFDFHAGTIRRAPPWMQRSGLEWLHRLVSEPRRLWRRYFYTNSAFILRAARQLAGPRVTD